MASLYSVLFTKNISVNDGTSTIPRQFRIPCRVSTLYSVNVLPCSLLYAQVLSKSAVNSRRINTTLVHLHPQAVFVCASPAFATLPGVLEKGVLSVIKK